VGIDETWRRRRLGRAAFVNHRDRGGCDHCAVRVDFPNDRRSASANPCSACAGSISAVGSSVHYELDRSSGSSRSCRRALTPRGLSWSRFHPGATFAVIDRIGTGRHLGATRRPAVRHRIYVTASKLSEAQDRAQNVPNEGRRQG
jgi:hypothetical protein